MLIPPLSDLVFAVIMQVSVNHFGMGENADVAALLVFQSLLVAAVREIQAHPVTLLTHRGIVGQNVEDDHVPGAVIKPGKIHVIMPFVILGTGTNLGSFHKLGDGFTHSGTCVLVPLR